VSILLAATSPLRLQTIVFPPVLGFSLWDFPKHVNPFSVFVFRDFPSAASMHLRSLRIQYLIEASWA